MPSTFRGRARRLPSTFALAAVVIGSACATTVSPSQAADVRSPRIVAAAMRDADGDARADRLRLTYSERVRHAADRDGTFPFRVRGYGIRAVGKASGKQIVVELTEQAAPDGSARPSVSYRRTRAQRVVDRARNQAARQAFRGTRAHANGPGGPRPGTPSTPRPAPAGDRDADGTPDVEDCAPRDPAIEPGATDRPDLDFVDADCDGIDGSERDAIFVSPLGEDANPGTRTAPKREISAAVVAASLADKDVYVAGGEYLRVETVSGVDIYGGYLNTTWARNLEARTRIVGRPEAVLAAGDKVVLQLLTAVALNGGAGSSAYAIRAVGGANLTLQGVALIANEGVAAAHGADGVNGLLGGDGGRGENGACDTEVGGGGGEPGASPAGFPGGRGGRGGLERLDRDGGNGHTGTSGTLGGAGGLNGNPGKAGKPGADGAPGRTGSHGNGGSGSLAFGALSAFQGIAGTAGTSGTSGVGGGGGGGGGGQKGTFVIDGVGNAGGGGGGGGGGGTAGRGGGAGGGSFGLYLHDATATVSGGSIQTGDGGDGGNGGRGGLAGPGGAGGPGATYCTDELGSGAPGGFGGNGGFGGGGGGGAGGPSIGVMKAGRSSATLADLAIRVGTPGAPGAPGAGGSGGTPAEQGVAAAVYP